MKKIMRNIFLILIKKRKTIIRKRRHINYVDRYLSDMRWHIINTIIYSSAVGHNKKTIDKLKCRGNLIRKYERRKKLLKF